MLVVYREKKSHEFPITNAELYVEFLDQLKVAFFQKVRWNFFRSPNLKKKIFQKTILGLKFKFSANNSKVL